MNKGLLTLAVAAAGAVLLTGCGAETEGLYAGLVTGAGGESGSAEISAIFSGIDSYAAAHSFEAKVYSASADTEEAYAEQFQAAAEDRVRYVICEGRELEVPVYQAQNAHKDQKFLLFNGEPRVSVDMESTIRKNTECVTFSRSDMGFLAGYVAIRGGYRSILYLSGEESDEHLACYDGFLRGAGYAMEEQNLSSGSLSVGCEFAGSDLLTPLRMTDAMRQYEAGVELIVTDTPSLASAIEQGAEAKEGVVATIGFDDRDASSSVAFAAVPDLTGVTEYMLESFAQSNGFKGGQVLECGAEEEAIRLAADYSRLGSFTEAGAESVLDAMAGGLAAPSGEEGEEERLPFSVHTVEPVTPDGSAGTDASPVQMESEDAEEGDEETESAEEAVEEPEEESVESAAEDEETDGEDGDEDEDF